MNKEEFDKYKKIVAELDGYDICEEFNLGTYELKDKKKLLEIVLMYYFKNQDELEEKDKEITRLNNIIDEARKYLTSYESIETIQQCEHHESNKGFDEKTMIEMCRRYLIVHDKLLDILELKENK